MALEADGAALVEEDMMAVEALAAADGEATMAVEVQVMAEFYNYNQVLK